MIIILFGICNGILGGWEFVPSWLNTILPYSIGPIYFITRHCTVNMVVAISIERHKALFSPLGSNPRCYSYILAVLLFSGKCDKIHLFKLKKKLFQEQYNFLQYRGSPPYTHFGTWKKPCYMKFVLVGLYCGPLLTLIPPLTRT